MRRTKAARSSPACRHRSSSGRCSTSEDFPSFPVASGPIRATLLASSSRPLVLTFGRASSLNLVAGGGLAESGGAVDGVLVELGDHVLAHEPDGLELLFL